MSRWGLWRMGCDRTLDFTLIGKVAHDPNIQHIREFRQMLNVYKLHKDSDWAMLSFIAKFCF